ncbi:nucleotide disphospho-sugar-binding domain-containing protein [Actinocrispum wychmicini]|uniref:Glycosyltransferase n=1 Tax=Actinocrispum wychmicini TaxID=1213861 RepID=A0A4R2IQG0_9PSEU|nr:nucleotide disphospho-sugar-binding domain-containing protein [Actinocrispum wychmicini]TCO46626.1 glycosyltransferase [Actinocrispum wychmicini]
MRVLVTSNNARQHLYPMVPLAWACRAAGHSVQVAAAPGMAGAMREVGLPAVVVGKDVPPPAVTVKGLTARFHSHARFPADWPMVMHLLTDDQRDLLEHLGRNAARGARAIVDDLVAYAREWRPDIVVYDVAGFAGAVTAAALGVPGVRHLTGYGLRPMENRPLPSPSPEPLPEYADLFRRFGVPVVAPALTIDPSPPSLRIAVPEPWREMRYVPYNGPGEVPAWLPEWLRMSHRRVCVTWGYGVVRTLLALGPAALDPLRDTLDALGGMDLDIVLATTREQLDLLGELPPNIRRAVSVPLQYLLPYCDLIVHQAGDGTALTAAALGVPQLAITNKPDQALTSDRLAAVGAGLHLRYQDLRDDRARQDVIRSAADKLLSAGRHRQAARRLRHQIEQQPTPADVVPALEAVA